MVEKYTLWKKVSNHGTGCQCDGSETWRNEVEYFLVSESEENDFYEVIADDYGNQDYSYIVKYDELMTFKSLSQLKDILKVLNLEVAKIDFNIKQNNDKFFSDILYSKKNKDKIEDLNMALSLKNGC
ncbi:MAG: hypothetical protein AB7V77_05825 [Candidatus Woesearchaeota archaeon]